MTAFFRLEKTCVFVMGCLGYGMCEILWRGYTHWTMLVLGGVCFLCLYLGEKRFGSLSLGLKCVCGGIFITSLELLAGSVVNIIFKMNVWDYSEMMLNLFGQVCLRFSVVWMLLCVPALFLCRQINGAYQRMFL